MDVGILTIGNELTGGRIQDTNAALIARALRGQGWGTAAILSVGDDVRAIGEALAFLLGRAEAVIVTGGLGPTADDITAQAVATAFELPMELNETVLARVRERLGRLRLPWTENNAKQALFPRGAAVIDNPTGTAAGFALRREGRVVAVMPGVPAEVRRMLPEGVIPFLRAAFPGAALAVGTAAFKLCGITEAAIDEAIADAGLTALGVEVGFYPNFPENHLVLTVRTAAAEETGARLREASARVEARLGRHLFARGDETIEGIVARLLTDRGLTLALAESCTGGLIADRLTDVPGSSAFLERGAVTYSNAAKTALLGVPEGIIAAHGAVSEETARLMAAGIRRNAGTDLGLAVTGIAGPGGGTESKPVGTVHMALAHAGGTTWRHHALRWDRRRNKIMAAFLALEMLRRHLTGEGRDG